MEHFFDFTRDELIAFCIERGLPRFAADQLLQWVYQKGVTRPGEMTNLSKAQRALIEREIIFERGALLLHQLATDGTQKVLLGWRDVPEGSASDGGEVDGPSNPGAGVTLPQLAADTSRQTETVMIPSGDRRTACVSSQVGCPVGCTFCASGLGGLDANLRAGQILEQVHHLRKLPDVGRITNIVFMGMGEPLANFNAVTQAIRTLHTDWGFGISARRITLSTVGLPQAIRKFTTFELPVTLALSLHAPNDILRRELIPWAEYTTIAELLDACEEYFIKTGREITLEYILLGGVNDQPEHARELAQVAKRLRANVNLIRYNEVKGMPHMRPATEDVLEFQRILRERGVNAHIRASRGRDIAAACGQLRHEQKAGAALP